MHKYSYININIQVISFIEETMTKLSFGKKFKVQLDSKFDPIG